MSLFILVFSLGYQILHTIAEIAMVRMVDQWDDSGEKIPFREAFQLGWSKKIWRIFLIYLTFLLQVFLILLFVVILIAIIVVPFIASANGNGAFSIVPILILLVIGLIGFVALIVFGLLVSAAIPLMIRSCVLDDMGVLDSVDRGYALCRKQLKEIGIMALLNYAVTIAWSLIAVMFRWFFSIVGLVLGGGVFWLLGQMTGLFNAGADPGALILPLAVGGLLYLIITVVPFTLAYAVQYIFQSSLWTLTYRQLPAPEKPQAVTEAVSPEA